MNFDVEIKALYKSHKDRFIFDSLPGAGPQIATQWIVTAAHGTPLMPGEQQTMINDLPYTKKNNHSSRLKSSI